MEKKSFRSRISVLLIVIVAVPLSTKLFTTMFYSDMYGMDMLGGVLPFIIIPILFVILMIFGMRYVISENKLYVKMCWVIPWGSIHISDITSVKRSYNLLSSPAASLKRLYICSKQGDNLLSPVREQEFCDALRKINPNISVRLDSKKAWYRIFYWDI